MPRLKRPGLALRAAGCCTLICAAAVTAVQALTIVDYNFTNYPSVPTTSPGARNPKFRIVLAPLGADILVTEEIQSQAGVDSIRDHILNALEPGQWASAPFINGNDTDNALFYKPSKVTLLGQNGFYPNPPQSVRLVTWYLLRPVGYTSQATEFRIYAQHLKASQGFESQRLAEATGIRDSMNAVTVGKHMILTGDFNIYTNTEPAFGKLLESQTNNTGRLYDPLTSGNWHNNGGFAYLHTQCPDITSPAGYGYSGGGLDDRFDMFLPTTNWNNGQGYEILANTYKPVGNDGLHFNLNITDPPTIQEGAAYASALWWASDHLPIRVQIQLPSRISVSTTTLAFGTVIVGAPAAQNLSITNPAVAPADGLDYSFTADADFGAPSGSFTLAAGASPGVHGITMSTASPGTPSGQLHIASDDPDHATTNVALSGTVLAHASASLDSLSSVLAGNLDFGTHLAGQFTDQTVHVHDLGYNALQARLSVTAGAIAGGAGHFSIVGGFNPALVAGTSQPYAVHFDETGATPDSTYTATLTFSSADEALPGATGQPDLVVTLQASLQGVASAVEGAGPVTRTRLYAPFPNPPVAAGTTLRFDLAQHGTVQLDVFDVAGRRLATLAQGAFAPGRYRVHWDARAASGRTLGSGVYFLRLRGDNVPALNVRVTLVR